MLSDKEKFLVIGGGTFTTGVPSVDADTGPDFYDAFLLVKFFFENKKKATLTCSWFFFFRFKINLFQFSIVL